MIQGPLVRPYSLRWPAWVGGKEESARSRPRQAISSSSVAWGVSPPCYYRAPCEQPSKSCFLSTTSRQVTSQGTSLSLWPRLRVAK